MAVAFDYNLDRAIQDITQDVTGRLERFIKRVQRGVEDREGMLAVHKEAASIGQRAMLESYEGSLLPHEYYHRTNRFGAGRLRSALASEEFFGYIDAEGIGFGDQNYLDETAAQWSRLNFGAAPAGRGVHREIVVGSASEQLTSFFFEREPSAAFRLPQGYFVTGGVVSRPDAGFRGAHTGGAFFATSFRKLGFTEGVAARDFIGDGIQAAMSYAGRQYGRAFEQLGQDAYKESSQSATRTFL